jgi:hypothetical protein
MTGPARTSRPLVAIQHHPSRADLLGRLLEGLAGLEVATVPDYGPTKDPWRGHLRCLESFAARIERDSFTHLAVIQDDALVCDEFECELHCVLEAEPDATLMLFLAAQPRMTAQAARDAAAAGEPFAVKATRDYLPAVGISYPAAHVADILEWHAADKAKQSRSDDFMLGRWHRERAPRVLATVPSLVQHPDDVPSVIGNGLGARGRNPARTALFWS